MTTMASALLGAVGSLARERAENIDIRAAIESVDRHELVSELAGTEDRRSRAYLSQARNIQRYVSDASETRTPRGRLVAVLGALTDLGADETDADDVEVEFEGAVIVSPGGKRPDERNRDFTVTIPGDQMTAVLRELRHGNSDDAAELFEDAILSEYSIGHSASVTDVDHLGLTWA